MAFRNGGNQFGDLRADFVDKVLSSWRTCAHGTSPRIVDGQDLARTSCNASPAAAPMDRPQPIHDLRIHGALPRCCACRRRQRLEFSAEGLGAGVGERGYLADLHATPLTF